MVRTRLAQEEEEEGEKDEKEKGRLSYHFVPSQLRGFLFSLCTSISHLYFSSFFYQWRCLVVAMACATRERQR
jgi:hypothetical protein